MMMKRERGQRKNDHEYPSVPLGVSVSLLLLAGSATIFVIIGLLYVVCCSFCFASPAEGSGPIPACHPAEARSTALWYVSTDDNTAVLLIARCPGLSSAWYVSFFTGEQPELADWYEIQRAASVLLRDGGYGRFVTNDVERLRARR